MKCGLLGRKLGHSYSPQIHAQLGNYEYSLFEKEPQALEDFLRNGDFSGLNVTMPYKKDVIAYLDELTPVAAKLGAVNTIVRRGKKLIGHNTDYFGFQTMAAKSGLSFRGKKCLILGSGGASVTVAAVLRGLQAQGIVISRSGKNNYHNLCLHSDAAIIVNTTPVGMYPNTGVSPINLDLFPHLEGVLDLVYNPVRTQLLMDAEKRGIPATSGLWMLVAQAWESAGAFTGTAVDEDQIAKVYASVRQQMENIVLIGMPGCGKSTIGRFLAEKCGKIFVDADRQIEELAQKSIPRIFSEDGEERFRDLETAVLKELGKQSGLVIATGGGCVTKAHNYPLLHQNGTIFWLQRDIHTLPTDGRPLSQTSDLAKMYAHRKPMYTAFADHIVDNNGTFADAVNTIWEVMT